MLDIQESLRIAISLLTKEKEASDYGYSALQDASETLKNLKDQDSAQRGLEGSLIETDPNYVYMPVSKDSTEMRKTSERVNSPPTGDLPK